tara:strand:+ start:349 stop:549 length:201 start_codon:yes stop_codon:yes gene_type:complete
MQVVAVDQVHKLIQQTVLLLLEEELADVLLNLLQTEQLIKVVAVEREMIIHLSQNKMVQVDQVSLL